MIKEKSKRRTLDDDIKVGETTPMDEGLNTNIVVSETRSSVYRGSLLSERIKVGGA